MALVEREVAAPVSAVWSVLADGWLYPVWVVGASRMRAVETSWPAVGSKLHHSVGVWPLLVSDDTEVLACEPERHLRIQARGWPLGEATVDFRLAELPGGRCRVTLEEEPTDGPGRAFYNTATDKLLVVRNKETLERLACVAEGRTQPVT